MDLVLGQPPAVAAAASAADAVASATAAANSASNAATSATAAAVSAASVGFTPGNSVVNASGKLEVSFPVTFLSGGVVYNITANDRGRTIAGTSGSITINLPTGASIGNGFVFAVRSNAVGGTVVINAAAGDFIDGAASITARFGEGFLVLSNGTTNWRTIGRTAAGNTVIINDGGQLEVAMPVRALSANGSVTLADRGFLITGTNAITLTLPAGAGVPGGFYFAVKNINTVPGTSVTLQAAAGDTIENASTFAVLRNQAVVVVFVPGAGWRTIGNVVLQNNSISNALLSDMASNTIKGNNTGATGDPLDLTAAQVAAMLPLNTNGAGQRTISTALPSGGADGDIWYQV